MEITLNPTAAFIFCAVVAAIILGIRAFYTKEYNELVLRFNEMVDVYEKHIEARDDLITKSTERIQSVQGELDNVISGAVQQQRLSDKIITALREQVDTKEVREIDRIPQLEEEVDQLQGEIDELECTNTQLLSDIIDLEERLEEALNNE